MLPHPSLVPLMLPKSANGPSLWLASVKLFACAAFVCWNLMDATSIFVFQKWSGNGGPCTFHIQLLEKNLASLDSSCIDCINMT